MSIHTHTFTKIGLRLMTLEVKSVVSRVFHNETLNRILDETICKKQLESLIICGQYAGEEHAIIRILFDYSKNSVSSSINVQSPGSNGFAVNGYGPSDPCPQWEEAVSIFLDACESHGLYTHWYVNWVAGVNECRLNDRYGLSLMSFIDRTTSGVSHNILNSNVGGLTGVFSFSDLFGKGY